MADNNNKAKPRANETALSEAAALRGAEITATDRARALQKWSQRVPGFLARLRRAKGLPDATGK